MKGIVPLIAIAALTVVVIVLAAGGALNPSAAILPSGDCYTSGSVIPVQTVSIKVTSSAPAAYFCSISSFYKSSGLVYNTECSSIGAVTKDQMIAGRTVSVHVPSDALGGQTDVLTFFVSTDSSQDDPYASDIWSGRVSEYDEAAFFLKTSCPVSGSPSGDRTVNYVIGCDNSNPDQGKIKICSRETYNSLGTTCTGIVTQTCEQNAVCESRTQNGVTIAMCFSKTGGAFGVCGDSDNICPGYDAAQKKSASCRPYQDRDCCILASGNWNDLSGITGGNKCFRDNRPLATFNQGNDILGTASDAVEKFIGAFVISIILLVVLLLLGLVYLPLGIIMRKLYKPKMLVIALLLLTMLIFVMFGGLALGGAQILTNAQILKP